MSDRIFIESAHAHEDGVALFFVSALVCLSLIDLARGTRIVPQ